MAIEINWADKQETILVWQFRGAWTVDEFRLVTRQMIDMSQKRQTPFNLILDIRNARSPRFPMTEVQRSLNIPVNGRDLVFVVTQDLFILSLLNVLQRLGTPNTSPERLRIASTMTEAYMQIGEHAGWNGIESLKQPYEFGLQDEMMN